MKSKGAEDKVYIKKDNRTVKYSPVPDYMACPTCGLAIELWTSSESTSCVFCGEVVFLCETTVH
ncbi:MAG: hypothetical protein ACYC69_04955 [Thermodesulfovibrionales bacterium]